MRSLFAKISLMLLFLFFLTMGVREGKALPIDEKVMGRVLGLSDTKRTILVNRGEEQRLKVGDHAKFSTPQDGYFARGVIVRVSPTRSVWSLYRFVKEDVLRENLVATIKISTPVEITEDATKDLGVLASTYDERVNEDIPEKQSEKASGETRENKLKDHIIKGERREARVHKGVDFSTLNPDIEYQRPEDIDWSALEESEPSYSEREDIDFSTLSGPRR